MSERFLKPLAEPLQPDSIEFHGADGVLVKSMVCKVAGTIVPQHAHTYDHMSMLAIGTVKVWRDEDYLGTFHAPAAIEVKAGCKHKFETVTDYAIIYCIHNVARSGEIEIADQHALNFKG
jgi:hypothetical protein